ncbi:MAG TPA: hypothetical protein VNN79_25205, partial [Actinomycetota bacterium]|nr:hypothetical protein [Actinomycetota bacterium]
MAFYGESYALWDLTNIAGTAADFGALYYHRDDESSSVSAGDSFLVGVWADPVEFGDLVAATDAVVSWVVETGEGSSGTLAISSGLDPTGAVTNTAYASDALGSFSVTGTQTIVAGPTSITSADLVAFDDEPVAFIQCTSGVVNILQVKLRVWPPTGAGGNWATGSAYERVGDRSFWSSEPNNQETAQVDGYAAAWALGRSDIDGLEGVPQGFLLGSDDMAQNFSLSHSATIPPFQEFADTSMQVVLLSATPPHVTTAGPGILGGVDPREHQYEDEAWARAVGGGPIAPTFIEWIEPATAFIDNIGQVGFEEVGAPSFTPHPTMSGWVLGTMTVPTPDGVTRAAGDHVPILQAEHQVIGVFAPNYFANPGTSSVSGTTGGLD